MFDSQMILKRCVITNNYAGQTDVSYNQCEFIDSKLADITKVLHKCSKFEVEDTIVVENWLLQSMSTSDKIGCVVALTIIVVGIVLLIKMKRKIELNKRIRGAIPVAYEPTKTEEETFAEAISENDENYNEEEDDDDEQEEAL